MAVARETTSVSGRQTPGIGRETFDGLAERHRHEIQVHCYRMLGSIQDAEDALQETLLNAWRGRQSFEGRASFRTWLYRIATNTCLRALERRAVQGRRMPTQAGPAVRFRPLGDPDLVTQWLEPYPDAGLPDQRDPAPGPEARVETAEAIRLAFVVAIHELTPEQRAILLLRDVVGMSAREAAGCLDISTAAANSALQRARSTIRRQFPAGRPERTPDIDEAEHVLLERYVDAWEARDMDGFVDLLATDTVWSMPPWRAWYVGPTAIAEFVGWVWSNGKSRRERLVPTSANGVPAFGYYRWSTDASGWDRFAIQLIDTDADRITAITNFVDGRLFDAFGLPPVPPRGAMAARRRDR
jgi:RNA polymerase sigma-70 factor (ECF subfamily)